MQCKHNAMQIFAKHNANTMQNFDVLSRFQIFQQLYDVLLPLNFYDSLADIVQIINFYHRVENDQLTLQNLGNLVEVPIENTSLKIINI